MSIPPLVILAIGIAVVLGMIIWLRINAFLALLTAAVVVSLLACINQPDDFPSSISRVAEAFGGAAANIGIVIGLAAVIGQCMMDSGAADRIVRAFLRMLGEKRSPWALMGSGYVLAVPVFFDTVFYLLVPLARSFYKRTGKNYLLCILAIAAGGAITHTLVPPTPGPLVMATTLGVDLGLMMGIGALVALPAAVMGIAFSRWLDRRMNIPLRTVSDVEEQEPLPDDQLPGLFVSLLPVLLPVVLIACNTIASTMARDEARETKASLAIAESEAEAVEQQLSVVKEESKRLKSEAPEEFAARQDELTSSQTDAKERVETLKSQLASEAGFWTKAEKLTAVFGNPNLALLISTAIAMLLVLKTRKPTLDEFAKLVEVALMSAGVIILITAAGASFGAMLKAAQIGPAIEGLFGGSGSGSYALLFLGFGLAALLKVAQGSSTAAMIVGSSMLAAIVSDTTLPFNAVYIATSIGAGSLIGSWMNDSGFWIFAKMGGLTETEALKSWTPLLLVLGFTSMAMTLLLASVLPLAGM